MKSGSSVSTRLTSATNRPRPRVTHPARAAKWRNDWRWRSGEPLSSSAFMPSTVNASTKLCTRNVFTTPPKRAAHS
ncbi:MAG: hypothetical protein CMM84_03285 [Rhodothermaceae bacterium]|nr:hypothetical protein [Rhodothermaceae bacterium]